MRFVIGNCFWTRVRVSSAPPFIAPQPSGKASDFDSDISLVRIQAGQPIFGGLAELVEALVLGTSGRCPCRFKSYIPHQNGSIAQSVEQRTENPCVASSILARATIKKNYTLYLIQSFSSCISLKIGRFFFPAQVMWCKLQHSAFIQTFNQKFKRR